MGSMIQTSLKLTKSTIRLILVRLRLSLDFSWYDRKQVLQDLSLVKHYVYFMFVYFRQVSKCIRLPFRLTYFNFLDVQMLIS